MLSKQHIFACSVEFKVSLPESALVARVLTWLVVNAPTPLVYASAHAISLWHMIGVEMESSVASDQIERIITGLL